MTRHRLYPTTHEHPNPDFIAPSTTRKREPSPIDNRRFTAAVDGATEFCSAIQNHEEVDATQLRPDTVVGLYILLHKLVYETEPIELRQRKEMMGAASAVNRLITKEFGNQIDQAFEFVRWTWAREKKRYERSESLIGDFRNSWRISWRYQFCSPKLLTDYRVALARSGKVAR